MNNHVTKIGVLGPAAPIFTEITWITIIRNYTSHENNKGKKIGGVDLAAPIFFGDHVDYYFERVYLLETQPTNYF